MNLILSLSFNRPSRLSSLEKEPMTLEECLTIPSRKCAENSLIPSEVRTCSCQHRMAFRTRGSTGTGTCLTLGKTRQTTSNTTGLSVRGITIKIKYYKRCQHFYKMRFFFLRGFARHFHSHKEAYKLEPSAHVLEDATSSNNWPRRPRGHRSQLLAQGRGHLR